MSTQAGSIRSLFLDGPVGKLEALLNEGSNSATHAALICHPHPVYGGTLHNKVVFHAMKSLHGFDFPVLRFNFRGAGLSQGEHDHGRGEVEDVQTALEWLNREFHLPMIFAGFSFGAAVGLRAACPHERVDALVGLGLPVIPVDDRHYNYDFLQHCAKPRLFISGSRDQYAARGEIERLVRALPEPKQLTIIEEADHFFEGKLHELRNTIEEWVKKTVEI
jgi:uncharacterized protein